MNVTSGNKFVIARMTKRLKLTSSLSFKTVQAGPQTNPKLRFLSFTLPLKSQSLLSMSIKDPTKQGIMADQDFKFFPVMFMATNFCSFSSRTLRSTTRMVCVALMPQRVYLFGRNLRRKKIGNVHLNHGCEWCWIFVKYISTVPSFYRFQYRRTN